MDDKSQTFNVHYYGLIGDYGQVRNSILCLWSHNLWQYFKNGTVERVAYLQDTLGFLSSTALENFVAGVR